MEGQTAGATGTRAWRIDRMPAVLDKANIGHGSGARKEQSFVSGVSALQHFHKLVSPVIFRHHGKSERGIGACGDRRTGLDTVAGADRGGSVEILSRTYCSTVCRSLIPRVVCSWLAASRSMPRSILRVICS